MTEGPVPRERRSISVLLVGSERGALDLVAELRKAGYEIDPLRVDSVQSLASALDLGKWDIALCEDGLPDLDGPTALRQIKRDRPELPVIVLSSVFGESIAGAAMKAGADDFIGHGHLSRLVPAVDRELRAVRLRRGWQQAARTLGEAQAQSAAFMDNSPAVAFLKDAEGRFVYVNRRFEQVFRIKSEDVLGKTDSEWLPADTAAKLRANDAAVLAAGQPMQFEESVAAPDGARNWIVSKFPFSDGSGAAFVGGVAVDITERKRAEEALRASEDLHRDLTEHSHVLICVHDLEGRILTVNAAAAKNLGYDRSVHLGNAIRSIQDILAPESRAGFGRYIAALRESGVASGIMVVQTRTGEKRHWEYRNTLRTEGVETPVVRGTAFDVTERIRAEQGLREARRFSDEIIASAGEGIIVFGRDLRYVLWNAFMEELTGLRERDVRGKSPLELFPHFSRDGTWELMQSALTGEKVASDDVPLLVPGAGVQLWVSSTFAPHRDADGEIVGVIGVVEDVTERKRAEEILEESRASLERAQEVGQIGSWVSAAGGRGSLVWSRETCRIFGIAPENFDGRVETFFSMVHPDDLELVQKASAAAISEMRPFAIEHRIVRPDHTIRWVYERADVVRDAAGKPFKMVGIVQDITERRSLEQQFLQSQKMEAIGRLAGGVAHDFNNLLTAILGYSDLLLSQIPAPDPMREDLEEIRKAGERAAGLTRQLLAFSRQQMLEPRVLDVNGIVSNIEKMLRRVIGEDVTLVTSLESDIDYVRADPGQLEQVIMNLAVNSRDAMPGGGTITIETRKVLLDSPLDFGRFVIPAGRYVVLEVRDSGTGMDAEIQARIFEPFFTTKEKGKGTGLGLATAYGIVKQSGGYIACESEPGRGTRFLVYLPRSLENAESAPATSPAPGPAVFGTETVLLVEDEEGVRRLSRKLLEAHGYQVLEASGGAEAIDLAARYPGPIHLVLTDVVMPGVDGPEVAARIAALRPGIKVLYMTGYTDAVTTKIGAQAPLLRKPFSPAALAQRVHELLAS
ncbi:MAG: PAS domain S-box protein [Acidobacteriota bacterium]|nr:PAS domain S-box protein [Acidobacteriota bacterium]